jgi:hypothetical protein
MALPELALFPVLLSELLMPDPLPDAIKKIKGVLIHPAQVQKVVSAFDLSRFRRQADLPASEQYM